MKKLFILSVLLLACNVAFATTNMNETIETFTTVEVENSEYTVVITKTVDDKLFCTEYHAIYYRGELVAEFESVEAGDDCGVTLHYLR